MQHINRILSAGLAATLGAGQFAVAAEWDTEASVAMGGVYTDNVCLSHQDEEEKWIATFTPSGRLIGEGARANMDLLFSLQFNTLADSSVVECTDSGLAGGDNLSQVSPAPRIRFESGSELLLDWLFLDLTAFADQNRVNAFGTGGGDNLNATGNLNTTYSYAVSPYVSRKLTQAYNFFLRYTYDQQENSEDIVRDSTSESAIFDLGSSPETNRFSVGVTVDYSQTNFDATTNLPKSENELITARVRSAYQFNRSWQVNGYVGRDWNDFVSLSDDIDGQVWDLGLQWTPSDRVTVAGGIGDRFFGSTPRFSIDYRHKHSELRFNYAKELTYSRDLRSQNQFNLDDVIGDPGIVTSPTTVTTRPIIDERFSLVYTLNGQQTTFGVNASWSEQLRTIDGRTSIFKQIGTTLQRKVARNLTLTGDLSWNQREGDSTFGGDVGLGTLVRDSDTWQLSLAAERDFTERSRVLLRYQFRSRNSDFVEDEYDENRVSLTFTYDF